jgi:hypothetical protein
MATYYAGDGSAYTPEPGTNYGDIGSRTTGTSTGSVGLLPNTTSIPSYGGSSSSSSLSSSGTDFSSLLNSLTSQMSSQISSLQKSLVDQQNSLTSQFDSQIAALNQQMTSENEALTNNLANMFRKNAKITDLDLNANSKYRNGLNGASISATPEQQAVSRYMSNDIWKNKAKSEGSGTVVNDQQL